MTHPLQIIALTGSAGTGKDTAADILVTHCGFTRLAFADALRTEVQAAFNVPLELLTRRDLKEMATSALAFVECNDMGFVGAILASPLGIQKEAKVHGVSPALIARMRRRNPARTAGTVWAGLGSRAGA